MGGGTGGEEFDVRARGGAPAVAMMLCLGLIAGCSGDDGDAAVPTPDPSASAVPATLTCSDETGDNADPSLDLVSVRLARAGDNLRVVFDHTEAPAGLPLSWVVGFVSANGKRAVELTAERRKNGDLAHAVIVNGDKRPVPDPVRITAEGMTTVFPVRAVEDLGAGVRWYSSIGVDGEDIDFCPGGADLREVLDIVPLALPERW